MGEKTLFICDPAKNTECTKESCHINGGECYLTSKKECEADDAKKKELPYVL